MKRQLLQAHDSTPNQFGERIECLQPGTVQTSAVPPAIGSVSPQGARWRAPDCRPCSAPAALGGRPVQSLPRFTLHPLFLFHTSKRLVRSLHTRYTPDTPFPPCRSLAFCPRSSKHSFDAHLRRQTTRSAHPSFNQSTHRQGEQSYIPCANFASHHHRTEQAGLRPPGPSLPCRHRLGIPIAEPPSRGSACRRRTANRTRDSSAGDLLIWSEGCII